MLTQLVLTFLTEYDHLSLAIRLGKPDHRGRSVILAPALNEE